MSKVYWTMRNGEKIDIDDMDINHLRNTLKMLIKIAGKVAVNRSSSKGFTVNGELAKEDADNIEIYKTTGMLPEDFEDDMFNL